MRELGDDGQFVRRGWTRSLSVARRFPDHSKASIIALVILNMALEHRKPSFLRGKFACDCGVSFIPCFLHVEGGSACVPKCDRLEGGHLLQEFSGLSKSN